MDCMVLGRSFEFHAAHRLEKHPGECKRLHGHGYRLYVEVAGSVDEETGMVMDFAELKERVNKVLTELDHRYLNELEFFKDKEPTAENILMYIAGRLDVGSGRRIKRLRLYETENSWAEYEPEEKIS